MSDGHFCPFDLGLEEQTGKSTHPPGASIPVPMRFNVNSWLRGIDTPFQSAKKPETIGGVVAVVRGHS